MLRRLTQFSNVRRSRRPADGYVANLDQLANGPRTGEILTLPVSVPGVGRP